MLPIANRNARNYLELGTNIAVVLAAITLVGFYSASYFGVARTESSSSLKGQTIGEIRNVNFQDSSETLLLVLSSGCRYCLESTPFYSKLSGAGHRPSLRILAVFPDEEPFAKSFLDTGGIQMDFRADVELKSLHVSKTPTILLIDRDRKVLDSWVGALSETRQAEVLEFGLETTDSDQRTRCARTTRQLTDQRPRRVHLFDDLYRRTAV